MKSLKYILFALLFLPSFMASAQEAPPDTAQVAEEEDDDTIYEDESGYIDYRSNDAFRLLDTLRGQLGIYALTMPFINQQAFGGGIDMAAWYTNNCAVGISMEFSWRGVNADFGYNIGQARILHYDFSLFNELKLTQWQGLEVATRLYTGYSAFNLDDKSVKVPSTWYDEYGNAYEGEEPLRVATNRYMRIAPAAVLRYHLSRNFMLEGSAVYNFFIGQTNFGHRNDFNNYQLHFGIKCNL